jgi:hypothetical protein
VVDSTADAAVKITVGKAVQLSSELGVIQGLYADVPKGTTRFQSLDAVDKLLLDTHAAISPKLRMLMQSVREQATTST